MAGYMFSALLILSVLSHTASAGFCINCGNCANDKNTLCEIDSDTPVCKPAILNLGGGCTSQVTVTTTEIKFFPTTTSTKYTSTVDSFETVSSLEYVTAADEETSTVEKLSTVIVTKTTTVPAPTTTGSPPVRRNLEGNVLIARDTINRVPSTTTSTIITTDKLYCINTPSDTGCTATVEGIWTNSKTTTIIATSTLQNLAVVTNNADVTSTTIKSVTTATTSSGSQSNTSSTAGTEPGIIRLLCIVATFLVVGISMQF